MINQLTFLVLDLRRLFHVAMLATVVAAVHAFGSPEARVHVDRFVVTPVSQTTAALGQRLQYSAVALRSVAKQLGWS